jgi:ATP-binding cassette subfamily B protein
MSAAGDALSALAHAAGLSPTTCALGPAVDAPGALDRWLEAAARAMGFEIEPVEAPYGELASTVAAAAPAIVRLPAGELVAIIGARGNDVVVLSSTLDRVRVPVETLADAIASGAAAELAPRTERWLAAANVRDARRSRARRELARLFLAERRIGGMWILRADPGASFLTRLRREGAVARVGWFALASAAQVAASVLGWLLVGRGALSGSAQDGWLAAWAIVALTAAPLALVTSHLGTRIGLDVSTALKQRLIAGALRMEPDAIRTRGTGTLLGMVAEASAVEGAGLSGAIASLLAVVQLVSAAFVLASGAGGAIHVCALVAFSAFVAFAAVRVHRRRARWTEHRLASSNAFVENVLAHRTRVVQQRPDDWHDDEDATLAAYGESSHGLDAASMLLSVVPSRGWLVVGFAALVPAILAGQATTAELAIAALGILQAQTAFVALAGSASSLLGADVSMRSVRALFDAASLAPRAAPPVIAAGPEVEDDGIVLDARALSFRHTSGHPVLSGCSLALRDGDRVLLEGASGSGKSTLASVLVGLRSADAGQVLLRGLDRATIGDIAWRERVATAPQFHDNHVLGASLAFNLLMGRAWPPSEDDRREAENVCRELGLGALVDRMPSGLDQIVGETGWQLSHGERSRVFLARALLQRSDAIVLDETFGALDPVTSKQCVEVVAQRARTLLVIAHP